MTASVGLGGGLAEGLAAPVVERFEILRKLGQGGTAAVYEAHDHVTGHRVALKLLHEDLTRTSAQRQEFLAEAQYMRRVRNPGVVRIIDCGEQDRPDLPPQAWVAMEIAEGSSLARQVREHGPLTVPGALALIETLLDAIDAVHRAGIVHRDITPANVMANFGHAGLPDGASIRLLDFGLAGQPGTPATAAVAGASGKAGDAGPSAAVDDPAVPSLIWGSAPYLSPEQASGSPVFESADLYQAGGVLYFALTGRAPFTRQTAEALMRAHVSDAVDPPSSHRSGVPAQVDRLVLRSLGKSPHERFSSAQGMRTAVRQVRQAISENEVITDRLVPVPLPASRSQSATELARARAGNPPALRSSKRGDRLTLIVGAAILVTVLSVGGVIAMIGGSDVPRVEETRTELSEPTVDPVEPTPTVAALKQVVVPGLVGRSLGEARGVLESAGLVVGEITTANGTVLADTVLAVADSVGVRVTIGTAIPLTIASGWNAVPNLAGLTEAQAGLALEAAGFSGAVGSNSQGGPASPMPSDPPLVFSSLPVAGTVARLGTLVTFTLGPAAPPTPTSPSPEVPAPPEDPEDTDDPEMPADPTETVHPPAINTSNYALNSFTRDS